MLKVIDIETPVSAKVAAQILGVSVSTVYDWADNGKIPCIKYFNKSVRFLASELYAFRQQSGRNELNGKSGVQNEILTSEQEEMMPVAKRNGVYYLDYYDKGRRCRRRLGTDKEIAELQQTDDESVKNDLEISENKENEENKEMMFDTFAKEYLEYSKANKKEDSFRNDRQNMNKHLMPLFAGMSLNEIDICMIEKFKNKGKEAGHIFVTNRTLSLLKHMFTIAIQRGYVTNNPAKHVKLFKEPNGRTRYLSEDEKERLLHESKEMVKSIVIAALNTGARKGELLKLKWSNVDLKNGFIHIVNSKNGEARHIPINDLLKQELSNIPRRGDFVFSKKHGQSLGDFKKAFKSACKRANIKDFRFHDLRHTFASYLAMNHLSERTIQTLLGHKSPSMTARYTHFSQGHLKEAVDSLVPVFGHKKDTN
jgi:excisionase family DNA binding protein